MHAFMLLCRLDEFRVWTHSRSQAEIQRDMYKSLTGTEPGLFAYWDFNDLSEVAPPRVNGDPTIAKDLTGQSLIHLDVPSRWSHHICGSFMCSQPLGPALRRLCTLCGPFQGLHAL